ncbi:MAG TPA: hypothetical protein VKQ30_16350 [Ktedonobacterales bacterium]|nr:hypothetical protein [Ktedonobacterales bacterium]
MPQARSLPISTHRVTPWTAALAGAICLGGLAFGTLEAWPLWATGLAVVLPWIPVFARQVAWVYWRYGWLALFYVLVVGQTGHFLEHVAQMIQIHVLGFEGAGARGIFGTLDIEWVHFIWNTWVLLVVLVLLGRFRANRWLWVALLLCGWHEVEHVAIFRVYLMTGVSGTPGILSQGGALAGGLPVSRPDLHFFYNLIETIPLVVGFLAQVQRMIHEWRQRLLESPRLPTAAYLERLIEKHSNHGSQHAESSTRFRSAFE